MLCTLLCTRSGSSEDRCQPAGAAPVCSQGLSPSSDDCTLVSSSPHWDDSICVSEACLSSRPSSGFLLLNAQPRQKRASFLGISPFGSPAPPMRGPPVPQQQRGHYSRIFLIDPTQSVQTGPQSRQKARTSGCLRYPCVMIDPRNASVPSDAGL